MIGFRVLSVDMNETMLELRTELKVTVYTDAVT